MRVVFIIVFLLFYFSVAQAEEFESSSFKVVDPVLVPSSYSSSTDYQLWGGVSQTAIGTSTITSFNINSGFFYFPFASAPTVTATAGSGQISLSWIASTGYLGWTVSGYNVGQSTTSGGPYTYSSSLGNVQSSTRTGLTNGTTYYFVVRAEDAFANSIATSTEVSLAPAATAATETTTTTTTSSEGVVLALFKSFVGLPPSVKISAKCGADINCDGKVDTRDFGAFLYYGSLQLPNPADFNRDGTINSKDLSFLFFRWTERLLTFKPESNLAISNNQGATQSLENGQKNNFTSEQIGRAGIRSIISPENIVSKTQEGFSVILRNTKTFIKKIFSKIRALF